eukprot:8801037-Pyramimonas_sp.AAC.2
MKLYTWLRKPGEQGGHTPESLPGEPSGAPLKRFRSSRGFPETLVQRCQERFHACLHAFRHA